MPKFCYCVACFAGSENALRRDLASKLPATEVLFPVLDRQEKHDGKWITRTYPLVPGYVFLYSDTLIEPREIVSVRRVVRLLGYAVGEDKSGSRAGNSGEASGRVTVETTGKAFADSDITQRFDENWHNNYTDVSETDKSNAFIAPNYVDTGKNYGDIKMSGKTTCENEASSPECATNENGDCGGKMYELWGADREFAEWIYDNGGHIGVSLAVQIGSEVRIIGGPLKHYEGVIKKLDKHRRSALVAVAVGESARDVWLSFQWMDARE